MTCSGRTRTPLPVDVILQEKDCRKNRLWQQPFRRRSPGRVFHDIAGPREAMAIDFQADRLYRIRSAAGIDGKNGKADE
jgi:hypothetical protein